jgi:hypothetical protein
MILHPKQRLLSSRILSSSKLTVKFVGLLATHEILVLPIAKVLQILGATIFLLCCGAKLR